LHKKKSLRRRRTQTLEGLASEELEQEQSRCDSKASAIFYLVRCGAIE